MLNKTLVSVVLLSFAGAANCQIKNFAQKTRPVCSYEFPEDDATMNGYLMYKQQILFALQEGSLTQTQAESMLNDLKGIKLEIENQRNCELPGLYISDDL